MLIVLKVRSRQVLTACVVLIVGANIAFGSTEPPAPWHLLLALLSEIGFYDPTKRSRGNLDIMVTARSLLTTVAKSGDGTFAFMTYGCDKC